MKRIRNLRESMLFWPALQLQRLQASALNLAGERPVVSGLVVSVTSYPARFNVTCDDDKIYPPNWLKYLLRASREAPESIVCYRGRLGRGLGENGWLPYASWPSCDHDRPSMEVFAIGSAGVLYPPFSLHQLVKDRHLACEVAPAADDLWLKLAAWKCGTLTRQVWRNPHRFTSIPVSSGHLSDQNLVEGNDMVLARLAREFGFTPNSVPGQRNPVSRAQMQD